MNKKTLIFLIFIFLSITIFTTCNPKLKDDPIFIDKEYLNQQISLRALNYANSFTTKDSIILELKYQSNNEIIFPNNYNVRIFEYYDDVWNEIKEKPTERNPPGEIILSPEKELPVVQIVAVFPDLPDYNRKYYLRIYILGKMKEMGDIKEVVAYTELILHP